MSFSRVPNLRLLPVTIFVAVLMFTVRLSDIWQGVTGPDAPPIAVTASRAQQPPPAGGDAATAPPPEAAKAAAAPPGNGGGLDLADPGPMSQAEIDVLQTLAKRRDELDKRGRELDMREGLLKAAEGRIDKKVEELKTLQGSIQSLLKKHEQEQDNQLASLVKIYENMKPKDAAKIFEALEMPVLLNVLERMSERKVAPIMAVMNPLKAKSVTSELANRRQLPMPTSGRGG